MKKHKNENEKCSRHSPEKPSDLSAVSAKGDGGMLSLRMVFLTAKYALRRKFGSL
jgi:hypothetical protein